jgi:hypothetical protein
MKNQLLVTVLLLLTLFSCKKEDQAPPVLSLKSSSIDLHSGDTNQIVVDGSKSGKFNYSSDNVLIADVDKKGLITANRVGETTIKVDGEGFAGECKLTVIPRYNMYQEPVTLYGISKEELKAKERRTLLHETNDGLVYAGGTLEDQVMYYFEEGKLVFCCIVLSHSLTNELAKYMTERYVIISFDPVLAVSVNSNFQVSPELQTNSDWWVIYYLFSTDKSASLNSKMKDLLDKYRKQMMEIPK